MDKKSILQFCTRFIGPMIVGTIIALINIKLVDKGFMGDITIIRILYTFSSNFIGFLKWFAPFMSLVLIATGIREIKGEVFSFLGRFSIVLISTLLLAGTATILVAHLVVPLYVTEFNFMDSTWPVPYFTISFFKYFDIFYAMLLGIIVGIIAQRVNYLNIVLDKCEYLVNVIVKHIIVRFSPLWIMGSFAASTYSSRGLDIVWFDLWLSFIILTLQFSWLSSMYAVLSKYSKVAFKKIIKSALKIFTIVMAMAGMPNSAIFPYLIEEQQGLGLNPDKAKFVTVSSFNMPGSLIAHIIFAYGLSLLFGLDVTYFQMFKYMVILVFFLVVSPAISGGVFAVTSTLLAPVLGFSDPMIALMSSMYFKQGSTNAAVNNCADFYLTGLSMRKDEFIEKKKS